MSGFGLDTEALEAAITKLEDTRDRVASISIQARELKPEELVAQDAATKKAYQAFVDQATGDQPGSLRNNADAAFAKLDAKIDEYKASVEEYRRAEDNATVDADRLNREA